MTRELKVLSSHDLPGDRGLMVAVETPEDMQGFSQGQAKAEIYSQIVKLEIDGKTENYFVRGFEMMGYEDREVGPTLGLLVRRKSPPISQCNLNRKP